MPILEEALNENSETLMRIPGVQGAGIDEASNSIIVYTSTSDRPAGIPKTIVHRAQNGSEIRINVNIRVIGTISYE